MKKDAKAEAIRYWWDKSLKSLNTARRELTAESLSFAVNRGYYALFYAVSALLLEEGHRFPMPRANRHFLSAHIWHITHRYHGRFVPNVQVVQSLRSVQNVSGILETSKCC